MIVRTWTSEAEIPRFKHFWAIQQLCDLGKETYSNFIALWKRADWLSLPVQLFLCMPPHPSAWEPLSDQVAFYSCRFNGSLPVSFVGTPHPPSIAQEPGSPSSLAKPTGMRTMRSVSESLEVVGRAALGKSGKQKEKAFLS